MKPKNEEELFIVISPSDISDIDLSQKRYCVVSGRGLHLGLMPNFYKRSMIVHAIQE